MHNPDVVNDLGQSQEESFKKKKDDLSIVKDILEKKYRKERLPKNMVEEMLSIRADIKKDIDKYNFIEDLSEEYDERIKRLVAEIHNPNIDFEQIDKISEINEKGIEIYFKNGSSVLLGEDENHLLFSLRLYFDSYKLAHNANVFRENIKRIELDILEQSNNRKLNFYSESEKREEVVAELENIYKDAGFTKEELQELFKIANLDDLKNLPIQKIKMMAKIKEVFARFVGGDKTKYVGLSVALMVPAFIQGYAPMLFADAFKDTTTDIKQIVLYALASIGSAGLSVGIQKMYKEFINNSYQKEGGMGEHVAKSVSEMPAQEIDSFGVETVENRTERGLGGYEGILNTFSFDVLPAITTLATSAVLLMDKSPVLAGGTVVASGITIVLDKYLQKYGRFWERQRDAEKSSEQMLKKIDQQLRAHMEIILAGEQERFLEEVKEFIEKNKISDSNKQFFRILENGFMRFNNAITMTLLATASVLAGGSADQTIAAILYTNNFNQGINDLLNTKRNLLSDLRDIYQMELMFNGHLEEEEKKEESRIDARNVDWSNGISLKEVSLDAPNKKNPKKILDQISFDITPGSMVHLSGISGSGKTTLLKVLSGYYNPSSGEVKLGNISMDNIKRKGEGSLYKNIVYLSQFPYLFEGTIRENLSFGLNSKPTDKALKETLEEVNLASRFNRLGEKISDSSSNGGVSGGETSRLGLARFLLKMRENNPKIVYLDEPTASVDSAMKRRIADILIEEKRKRPDTSFVIISHDEEFIKLLSIDKTIEIKEGKLN